MAFKYFDRVKETGTVSGTGPVTLLGAVTKFLPFSSGGASYDTVVLIESATDFEVSYASVSSGTVTRGTVISSSNSGAAVNFPSSTSVDVCITNTSNTAVSSWVLNTAAGYQALYFNTTGDFNAAYGHYALYSNTTGSSNTAYGRQALYSNTTAENNLACGVATLYYNSTGDYNVAVGNAALFTNDTGSYNTAFGIRSLVGNTTGVRNTTTGYETLYSNTTGTENIATGYQALYKNTIASRNIAYGHQALYNNTIGEFNVATGYQALYFNITGSNNVATGYVALNSNTTGSNNTATGSNALYNNLGSGNIGIGGLDNTGTYAPAFNITTQDNYAYFGSTTLTNAFINVAWTVVSDERDKTNFASAPYGLELVKKLNVVQYQRRVDRESEDAHGPVRLGFKAQEVLALEGDNPVIIDASDPERLYYNESAMVATLTKALQELTAKFEAYVATHP